VAFVTIGTAPRPAAGRPWPLRPPWRTFLALGAVAGAAALAWLIWSPGLDLRDGRHDLGTNGIWLSHGWLGDDGWFASGNRRAEIPRYRSAEALAALAARLRRHGIADVFPHLCPARPDGRLPAVDDAQVERLLDALAGRRVMPWIGGVLGETARPAEPAWRAAFCASARDLLVRHPRLAGVQVNVEPCPSGDSAFLELLGELRRALPAGKRLSVAAYPPPTWWHPHRAVHWDEAYYRAVAARCDGLAVMMYDTGLRWQKPYRKLMADWTREVLAWSGDREVLLGLPAYDDANSGYHRPDVENLDNALLGIHAGLGSLGRLPAGYRGVAIYCDWEMDESEWALLRERFLGAARTPPTLAALPGPRAGPAPAAPPVLPRPAARDWRTVHVFVPLCDNRNQGIVKVPAALGDGQSPDSNLYWGARYGLRTFLSRSAHWKRLDAARPAGRAEVLERAAFRHAAAGGKPVYLVADAYDGARMREALATFLSAAAGGGGETLELDGRKLALGGGADLVAFCGHNGLMDLRLESPPRREPGAAGPGGALVLACKSRAYFAEPLAAAGCRALLVTTDFMAPEAYTLDAAVRAWAAGAGPEAVRRAAAAAYAEYQKCGAVAAGRLFAAE
jgi:hypothetical protein